jgi:hypothetical protein
MNGGGVSCNIGTHSGSTSRTLLCRGLARDAHQRVDDLRHDGRKIARHGVRDCGAALEYQRQHAVNETTVALSSVGLETLVADDIVGDIGAEQFYVSLAYTLRILVTQTYCRRFVASMLCGCPHQRRSSR